MKNKVIISEEELQDFNATIHQEIVGGKKVWIAGILNSEFLK